MKFSMSGKVAAFFTRIADMAILSLPWIVMCINDVVAEAQTQLDAWVAAK